MRILCILASTAVLTSSLSAQVPNYVPTNGLVGWWPFNGNANDESGNGNNGTVNGATLTADRYGMQGSAFQFNGVSDWIDVSDSPSLNPQSEITISVWLLSNTSNVNAGIIGKWNDFDGAVQDGQEQYAVTVNDNNNGMYFLLKQDGLPIVSVDQSPTSYNNGVWHHVLCTWDGLVAKLYFDGAIVSVELCQGMMVAFNQNLEIGRYGGGQQTSGGNVHFNGSIDDVGVWNRALTTAEIQALFSAALPPPCVSPAPVSFTGLGSSYTLADAPVTLVGTPVGGVFIGPGVSGNNFDPAAAGVGTHSIQYVYVDGNNCVNAAGQCTEVLLNVGVGGSQMGTDGVRVFPNPNRGQFTIELDLTGLVGLQVYDARGALVHNEVFQASGSKTTRNLDLSTLAKGSYTLQVRNGGGVVTQQVVIE